jgi:hypothetical protein
LYSIIQAPSAIEDDVILKVDYRLLLLASSKEVKSPPHPTTLAATVGLLNAKPDIGMVYTDYQIIDPQGTLT